MVSAYVVLGFVTVYGKRVSHCDVRWLVASVAQLAASIHRLVKSSVKSMHLFQLLPPDVTPALSPVSTPANFAAKLN